MEEGKFTLRQALFKDSFKDVGDLLRKSASYRGATSYQKRLAAENVKTFAKGVGNGQKRRRNRVFPQVRRMFREKRIKLRRCATAVWTIEPGPF